MWTSCSIFWPQITFNCHTNVNLIQWIIKFESSILIRSMKSISIHSYELIVDTILQDISEPIALTFLAIRSNYTWDVFVITNFGSDTFKIATWKSLFYFDASNDNSKVDEMLLWYEFGDWHEEIWISKIFSNTHSKLDFRLY